MLIQNPFGAKHVRLRWKENNKEVIAIQSDSRVLDIPEDCEEAVVEAIYAGKSDSKCWSIKMWTKERGFLTLQDYKSMKEVQEEQKKMEEERQKAKERKRKEAQERKESKWDS